MMYVVNIDVEVEAATPELAEDMVLNMLEDIKEEDMFVSIVEVRN